MVVWRYNYANRPSLKCVVACTLVGVLHAFLSSVSKASVWLLTYSVLDEWEQKIQLGIFQSICLCSIYNSTYVLSPFEKFTIFCDHNRLGVLKTLKRIFFDVVQTWLVGLIYSFFRKNLTLKREFVSVLVSCQIFSASKCVHNIFAPLIPSHHLALARVNSLLTSALFLSYSSNCRFSIFYACLNLLDDKLNDGKSCLYQGKGINVTWWHI